jgi:hypothetical protein
MSSPWPRSTPASTLPQLPAVKIRAPRQDSASTRRACREPVEASPPGAALDGRRRPRAEVEPYRGPIPATELDVSEPAPSDVGSHAAVGRAEHAGSPAQVRSSAFETGRESGPGKRAAAAARSAATAGDAGFGERRSGAGSVDTGALDGAPGAGSGAGSVAFCPASSDSTSATTTAIAEATSSQRAPLISRSATVPRGVGDREARDELLARRFSIATRSERTSIVARGKRSLDLAQKCRAIETTRRRGVLERQATRRAAMCRDEADPHRRDRRNAPHARFITTPRRRVAPPAALRWSGHNEPRRAACGSSRSR